MLFAQQIIEISRLIIIKVTFLWTSEHFKDLNKVFFFTKRTGIPYQVTKIKRKSPF